MDWFLYGNGLCHEKLNFCVIQTFTRLRHLSPQNVICLKEFETTTREIGLIIYRRGSVSHGDIKFWFSGSSNSGRHRLLLQFHQSY